MATDRITRIRGSNATAVGVTDRVTRARGRAVAMSGTVTDRITHVVGRNAAAIISRITRMRGRATTAVSVTVNAGGDINVEPYSTVQIFVQATGSPTTVTLSQLRGTQVDLIKLSATTWQYESPATLPGTILAFRATAVGTPSVIDEVEHTVFPHTVWRYSTAGTLVPVRIDASLTTPSATAGLGMAPLGTSPLGA